MNEGRRREIAKICFDVAKYFATIVGGSFLLKAEILSAGLWVKTVLSIAILVLMGWFMYPKENKEDRT